MFDLDNVLSYPTDIEKWVLEKKDFFLKTVPMHSYEYDYEIIHKLIDVWFGGMPDFMDFVNKYQDSDITGWHITRIENIEKFQEQGILTMKGSTDEGERRITELLKKINAPSDMQQKILDQAKVYWKRDKGSRTNSVHFFFTKEPIINDAQAMMFAANLGGEILNWALQGVDGEAYRQEPYKRLWIWGTPCRVKFKYKLNELRDSTQEHIIREIVFYFVMKDIYNLDYLPSDTGEKFGEVLPQNILQIEKIDDYEKIMGQYSDFENFYE